MSYQKILIPVDGSVYSDEAIVKGCEFAKAAGSSVTILFVKDRAAYLQMAVNTDPDDVDGILGEESDRVLVRAAEMAESLGVSCETVSAEGNPGRTIAELAEKFDLVVMGTAGRTGIRKMLMGSVTQYVIANTECPVMAVKIKE
ncbi:MAG: universal stress protein [Candidatus Methanomethylophilus sp.]|nr:universal stress protein [Methanomethylophilus sp.]